MFASPNFEDDHAKGPIVPFARIGARNVQRRRASSRTAGLRWSHATVNRCEGIASSTISSRSTSSNAFTTISHRATGRSSSGSSPTGPASSSFSDTSSVNVVRDCSIKPTLPSLFERSSPGDGRRTVNRLRSATYFTRIVISSWRCRAKVASFHRRSPSTLPGSIASRSSRHATGGIPFLFLVTTSSRNSRAFRRFVQGFSFARRQASAASGACCRRCAASSTGMRR